MDDRKLLFVICLLILMAPLLSSNLRVASFEAKASDGYPIHNLDTGLNYTSIQEAIDATETLDGHTILVEEGIYHEHIMINKSVFLIGANTETTVLDGEGNGTVILIQSSTIVSNFTIRNGHNGVALILSNDAELRNNVICDNNQGVYLSRSNDCSVSENLLTNNYYSSIILNSSEANVLKGNIVSQNHYYAFLETICSYNSSYNTITSNTIVNNQADGIRLNDNSHRNTITNNLLMNNLGGILLVDSCNYNLIEFNTVLVNETVYGLTSGIWIRESERNIVISNVVTSDRTLPADKPPYQNGVGLSRSSNNSIIANKISLMDVGIGLHFSDNGNRITCNIVTWNGRGIDFSEGRSSGNFIHLNSFVENIEQAFNRISTNTWDAGYPSGGNYWSEYNGTDTNNDGIGDTPYEIDSNNTDTYPLMGMFQSFNTSSGYHVNVVSNSTIEDFEYFESTGTIRMFASYEANNLSEISHGFCRVCIPYELMNVTNISVVIDDGYTTVLYPNYDLYDNTTHKWIYFAYEHSTHKIEIILEFPAFLIPLLFMTATLLAAIIYKGKHIRK